MMNTIKIEENILYEDKNVVVCCKPAGFPVQTRKPGCMDMESALRNYLAGKGQGTYLAVIHRLDQPVQGILVFAKNKGSAADLSQQIQQGKMEKKYLAYVQGKPEEKKGRLVNEMEKENFVQQKGGTGLLRFKGNGRGKPCGNSSSHRAASSDSCTDGLRRNASVWRYEI